MRPMGSLGSGHHADCAAGLREPSASLHNNTDRGESQTEYEGLAWVEPPSEEVPLESELESELESQVVQCGEASSLSRWA